ncbi:NADC pyrophosphorylase, partial [Rhinopomastus cyanomelas]|nr:NADC pyrophosphorylase [Rhinopomastus cyanomelas]
VEASSLPQALAAASAGADIVLLDNFAPEELQQVARRVKVAHPGVILEASGGVTPALLPLILTPDLDVVSMGCLTHSAPSLDFALRV